MKVLIKIDQFLGFSSHYSLKVFVDGELKLLRDLKSYYHLRDYLIGIVAEAERAGAEIEVGGDSYFMYGTIGD